MTSSNLERLVSLKQLNRAGDISWMSAMTETRDGRVRVHRIGSDIVECDVTPSLMRTLIERGYATRGACKVWRVTIEELGSLAVTVLALAGIDAKDRASDATITAALLKSLCAISQVNVEGWARSFGLDLCDVEDLVPTPESLANRMASLPADRTRALRVLDLIAGNVREGASWVRREGLRDLLEADAPAAQPARPTRPRLSHSSRISAMGHRGAA